METTFYISAILILTFLSGYFSGSEAAFFSLPAMKIKYYLHQKDPKLRLIAKLLLRPRDLLVTIFILNTLVNILLQNMASSLFGQLAGWSLKVGVPLLLTLIFGEIIPKYIGIQNNVNFSYSVVNVINFLQILLSPIRKATIAITQPVSRVLFFFLKKEPQISTDEIRMVLKSSEEQGVFTKEEGELISGYVELQEATVREIMWPREDIIYYNINEPITKLIYLFVDKECSRLPVCDGTLDNILGIFTIKKFLQHRDKIKEAKDIKALLARPLFIPETTPARLLLKRFHEHQQVFSLIVDEYGNVTGVLTLEDLMEIVIGEILDRRNEKPLYTRASENEIITSGKLELIQFNELFSSNIKSKYNMTTIGGWLIEQLGEIPKSGSKYEFEGFLFHVLAATPQRIRRLYIRKMGSLR